MARCVLYLLLGAALLLGGCQKNGPVPVAGKVKFSDGGIPQGEISEIVFEPEDLGSGNENVKGASGKIQPDGSFTITTLNLADSIYTVTLGEETSRYTVTVTFERSVSQQLWDELGNNSDVADHQTSHTKRDWS